MYRKENMKEEKKKPKIIDNTNRKPKVTLQISTQTYPNHIKYKKE